MMKISKSKFVKSAISILLVVMMLLSAGMSSIIAVTVDMVSESANVELAETGADNMTIYFKNSNTNWPTVNVHYWGGSNGTGWPGTAMTKVQDNQDNIYSVSIPDNTTGLIFNNGIDVQTENLSFDKTKNLFTATDRKSDGQYTGTWSTYQSTTPTTEYVVKFIDHDNSQIGGDQTINSGECATAPADPSRPGYTFDGWQIDGNGDAYTAEQVNAKPITANTTFKAKYTQVVPASNFYIHSTFFDPNWSDTVKFQTSDSENIGSLTLTIKKGNYEFKITDGTWYGSNDKITDTTSASGVVFSTSGGNCNFVATTDGTYTFTLDTSTMKLTVTKDEQTSSTITVYGTNGSISGAGTTSFKEGETVVSTTTRDTYVEAKVVPDEYFTINTQIQATGSTYDWYVKGYVINGKEFVEASSMGPGLYSANIRLSAEYDKADIVPIYFHTDEYRARYDIDTITFYAVVPKGINNWTPDNGNSYLSAYTWYYTNDETPEPIHGPFGEYPGQLMIPMKGDNNLYYTIVENKAAVKNQDKSDIYVSGVTLNNYQGKTPLNTFTANVQTYDFYEFASYAKNNRDNITFVLKKDNTKYNKLKLNGTSSINPENFQFTDFVNYNNEITNIFGEVKDEAWFNERVNDNKVLHVVRVGNKNYKGTSNPCNMDNHPDNICPLTGQWYVDAYIYGPTGNYINKCHSYQLSNGDMNSVLEDYRNYAVKVSYEKSTVVKYEGGIEGDNEHTATRWDGEWYADDKNTTVDVSVNVAISEDDGKNFQIVEDAQNKPGTALVNGLSSVSVTRGEEVSLSAQPNSGYRFVGWANANGGIFSNNVSVTVDKVAISTSYTAVYQRLASDQFYLNHYLYSGAGTAPDNEIPTAHNGSGDLYVQIENLNKNTDTGLLKQNCINVEATWGDKLRITIATDPAGINEFYAWYVGAKDSTGKTTYEEVGVDSFDNMAMPGYQGEYNSTHTNSGNTVIGETNRVYYQFIYIVGTEFNLTLYSDIVPKTSNKTLIYTYNDRGNGFKDYYVNIELTPEEIEAGYIPSETTIKNNAPYVGDYYKDIEWVIEEFDKVSCKLLGTNKTKSYSVTTVIKGKPKVENVPYNTQFTIDASDYGFSKGGFWYQETNEEPDGYTQGVDPIIANGTCYSYVVTKDMVIGYEEDKNIDFKVSLDAPVYGREQSTDSSGNNKVDKVVVDYVVNMVTPNVYGDGSVFKPWYNGVEISDNWSGQMVTIESLKKADYVVSFGVLLEQVDLNYVINPTEYPDDFATFEDALADAKKNGYGTAATEKVGEILNSMTGTTKVHDGKYYINYNRTDAVKLTNKNRYLFTIELNNTLDNRAAYYNVYAYMIVKAPGEESATIYISNVQTLNIHTTGTKNVPQQ